MNILITGCGGFVGSHLAEALLKRGDNVIGLDIAGEEKIKHLMKEKNNFAYVRGSVLDEKIITKMIMWSDTVYHFAAIADPSVYCNNPIKVLEIDLEATQLIVKTCHLLKRKLVFSSTSEIYGKNPKVPWKEGSDRVLGCAKTNRWCYSTSKAMGEHYCRAYGMDGLRYVILRFFNFYGPRLDFIGKGRVMTCFLEKFIKGEPVEVVEPGDQTRCFTYIEDGVSGIIAAAEKENDDFNLGSDREISIYDLAVLMKKIGGFKSDIKFIPAKAKYGEGYDDIPRRIPDCAKAERVLGWKPEVSLEEGIKRTIASYI